MIMNRYIRIRINMIERVTTSSRCQRLYILQSLASSHILRAFKMVSLANSRAKFTNSPHLLTSAQVHIRMHLDVM